MSYMGLSILCGFFFVVSTISIFLSIYLAGMRLNLRCEIEDLKNNIQNLRFDKQEDDIEIAELKEKLSLYGILTDINLDYRPSEYMDMNSALISFLEHLGFHYKGKARSFYDLKAGLNNDFMIMQPTSTIYVSENGCWTAYPYKTFIAIKENNK